MIFFSALLIAKRDLFTTAGRRILGMEFPRARDLAPLLLAWGVSVGVAGAGEHLGTSLLYFGVMLVLLYTRPSGVSWLIIAWCSSWAARWPRTTCSAMCGTGADLADPLADYNHSPSSQPALFRGHRGSVGPARRRPAGAGAVRLERLHRRLDR